MNALKGSGILGWTFGVLLVGITLLVMFPPEMGILKKGAEFAVYIMLTTLFLGMVFMILNQKKLMFLSLACTAILSLFLKGASNSDIIFPKRNNQPTISIAHINLSYVEQGYDALLEVIEELNPEVISFQEMTPDWDFLLKQNLSKKYISKYSLVRIDPYGMAIYSKKMIAHVDTFSFENIPNIMTELRLDSNPLFLISSYMLPPLNNAASLKIKKHLGLLSEKVEEKKGPIFTLGDYNLVPWSNEIREYREETNMLFSRRNIAISKFRIPYDHIMYSSELECIDFQEIEEDGLNHIGIYGLYQLKNNS